MTKQIAILSGVSVSTVYRALRGLSGNVFVHGTIREMQQNGKGNFSKLFIQNKQ